MQVSGLRRSSHYRLFEPFSRATQGAIHEVKPEISNAGRRLHEETYGIDDNQSFGAACADVWVKIRESCRVSAP